MCMINRFQACVIEIFIVCIWILISDDSGKSSVTSLMIIIIVTIFTGAVIVGCCFCMSKKRRNETTQQPIKNYQPKVLPNKSPKKDNKSPIVSLVRAWKIIIAAELFDKRESFCIVIRMMHYVMHPPLGLVRRSTI